MPVQFSLLLSFPPTDMIAHFFPRRTESGFTLIEICMVLVLLGILSAVAVPKYFDLQEESRLRAADAAIAEAQARINAYFGQQLLADGDCIKAAAAVNADLALPSGKIADATNAQGKVFGDVTLSIGKLLANGSPTLVTAYFDGKALSGSPHGRLFLAKCTDAIDVSSALSGFNSIGATGNGGAGVVASYEQSNSPFSALVRDQAKVAFDALMDSLGWEGDVGYWRVVQNASQTNVFWTKHDISGLRNRRVPFIQAQKLEDGTIRYAVGLIGVVSPTAGAPGAMLIQDSTTGSSLGNIYKWNDSTTGFYLNVSADKGYSFSESRNYYSSSEEAFKAYKALEGAFAGNETLVSGAPDSVKGITFH